MGISLYEAADPRTEFSSDLHHVFTITFDGRIGGIVNRKIYLRNDNQNLFYTNISVRPLDSDDDRDITNESSGGWFWKLAQQDLNPLSAEWNEIEPANTITISNNIGSSQRADIATFVPIWVQVSVPRGQDVQTIKSVALRIIAKENLVLG